MPNGARSAFSLCDARFASNSDLARGVFDESLPSGSALPLATEHAKKVLARQRPPVFFSHGAVRHGGPTKFEESIYQ